MRVVIQRVSQAKVTVDGKIAGQIQAGLLVFLGIGQEDTEADGKFIADKICGLRIFTDTAGKMNLSLADIEGSVLLISQFTLYGDCRKGRRPGFDNAGPPEVAEQLYLKVAELIKQNSIPVETGKFAAHMEVTSVNDGPVTLMLDSKKLF